MILVRVCRSKQKRKRISERKLIPFAGAERPKLRRKKQGPKLAPANLEQFLIDEIIRIRQTIAKLEIKRQKLLERLAQLQKENK